MPIVAPSFYDDLYRENGREKEGLIEQVLINPTAKLQLTELDHETPLFKISDNTNAAADPESMLFSNLSAIDGQIYKTSWSRLLGTELIFDEYGELVGTVREHLVSDTSVKIKSKPTEPVTDGGAGDDALATSDLKTVFLKKAIAAARAKTT